MKSNIFLIDGTSGIYKECLFSFIEKSSKSILLRKKTTRKKRDGEDAKKLDLDFVNKPTFDEMRLDYCYEYDKNDYGISKKKIEEALAKKENIFIFVRCHDVINQIKEEFKHINVAVLFVYTSFYAIQKRNPKLVENEYSRACIEEALQSYYRNPSMYDYVILNAAENSDFIRQIDCVIRKAKTHYYLNFKKVRASKSIRNYGYIMLFFSCLLALLAIGSLIAISVIAEKPIISLIIAVVIIPLIFQIFHIVKMPETTQKDPEK